MMHYEAHGHMANLGDLLDAYPTQHSRPSM